MIDYDAERGLLSSCQQGDTDFEIYSYALEQGVTSAHFTDKACSEYWTALVTAEKTGDFGSLAAMQVLGTEWCLEHVGFHAGANCEHTLNESYPASTHASLFLPQ